MALRFTGLLLALVIAAGSGPVARAQTVDRERAVLLELFKETDGTEWKRKRDWGTDRPICQWEGVECLGFLDTNGPVVGLRLRANNLRGVVPNSLTTLPQLAVLDLADNQLRGDFPETMFDQADANRLELSISGNPLSNLLTKVSLRVDSFSGTCVSDARLQLWFEVDGLANRAVYQSVRCNVAKRRNADDQFYCAKHSDQTAPALDGVSRALRRLSIASARSHTYGAPAGFQTHSEDLTAKLTWGNGVSQVVSMNAGQAPIDVWMALQLLKGLESRVWEHIAKRVDCESLTWPN